MTNFSPDDLYKATVYDRDGSKVGKVQQVYLDDNAGSPSWITVNTGFFGTNESLVPLEGAAMNEDVLKVPFDKQQIKDAPNYDPGHHLDERDEDDLYRHYGLAAGGTAAAGTGLTDRDRDGRLGRDRDDRGFDPLDRDNDGQRFDDPDHGRSGRDRDRGFDPLDRDNDGQRFDDPNRGDLRDRDRDALRDQKDREGDRGLGPAVGAGAAGAAAGAAGAGMAGRGDRDRGRDRDGDWDRDRGRGRDDRGFDPLDRDNDGERFDDPNRGRSQDRLTEGHEGEPLDPQQGGGLRDTSRHDSGGLGRGGEDDQALQRERELLERERELLERDKELLNREQGRGRLRRHDRGQGY
ncbi:PRC-barrel domain-containing protein [Ammonicoccus fulvus]|uniref:PRC-barrel domain-containing protein n=1 Tax=Ammonicoccus fulvus TaxID=3138240 RepID=A0ABZ3FS46_9ACTN